VNCFATTSKTTIFSSHIVKKTKEQKSDARRSDIPSPSAVIVDADTVKPSAFLLVGVTKGIWHVKLHTKTPSWETQAGQPAIYILFNHVNLENNH